MQETREKPSASSKTSKSDRTAYLFMESALVVLHGVWSWDLYCQEIFCSDVMMSVPPSFEGTRGIFHPDDVEKVKKAFTSETPESEIEFRMITTYGEVKKIKGVLLHTSEDEDEAWPSNNEEDLLAFFEMRSDNKDLSLKKLTYEFGERISRSGAWFINTSANETWYSDFIYRLHGIQPQTLNPHPHTFHSFIHPDDLSIVAESFDRAMSQHLPLHIEYRVVQPDGNEKKILQTTSWSQNAGGENIFHGVMQDVTEMRETENAMEAARLQVDFGKQLLQLAENNTNIGYWHLNLVTRKVVYSEHCYRIYGLKPQNLISGSGIFQTYVHPDDQEIYTNAIDKIRKERVVPEIDYRIVRPDGKLRYVKQKGRPVNSGGEIIMAGTIQDITGQKLMQAQLKELGKKLATDSIRAVQNESTAGLGSWLWNLNTGEIDWSDNLFEMVGYKPNAIKGTDKILLRAIHPDDQKLFRQHLDLASKEKQESDFRFRLIRKTGVRHLRAFFRLVVHEGEEMFVATFQDVTTEFSGQIELNERIQLIETLSDSIPDIVIVTNTDNNIVQWNSRCEEVYNLKKEDVIGENFFDVFPHLKGEGMINDVNIALLGSRVELKEYHTNRYRKGIFNIRLVPLKDETGNVIGVLHMLHDITREHHLHQELTGRLQFIEKLLEATVDRIIVLDRNMNYLYWNKRAEDYYGISKEDVIGKNILETFPAFMNDPSYMEFRNVLKGEIVHIPAEKNLHNKKGYFETYLIPVKTKDGAVTSILWITHDLHKEFQLQRQKMKEHEVLDALNENYLELDAEYVVTYINQKGEEFLGMNKEDIIGSPIWEVFPEAGAPPVFDDMKKAMVEGISTRDEYLSPSTGAWLNISIAPTIDGIVMLFFDIQHIKESQEKLKEEHRRLQETQSIGHIGSFDWDAGSDRISWSAEMYRISGLEPSQKSLTLEEALQQVHPEDYQEVQELISEAIEKAGIYNNIHRVVRPNGEVRMVDRRMRSFENEKGVVTFLTGTVQDITERAESEKKLVEMQKRLQQTAEASPDAITIYDVVNRSPEYINDNLGKWIGYTSEELVAMGYKGRLALIFPEDRPKIVDSNRSIGELSNNDIRTYEYRIVTRDARIIWVRNRSKIFERDESGAVTHILSVVQEITKEKAAQDELDQLNKSLESRNKELEEKNEEIGQFSFVASHDLKQPLRKIHTYTDWLLNNEAKHLSDTGKMNLEKIDTSVRRMESLIEDILILTRMIGYVTPPAEVDMNQVLGLVRSDLGSFIEASGAKISSDFLPTLNGHEKQLHQLLKNLLQNAIKFARPGSVPEVKISTCTIKGSEMPVENASPEINYIRISVSDNGTGIDEMYRREVFEMFQKLYAGADGETTGAGLFICKKIMENHNGLIGFTSEAGKGAIFSCYFPLS